MTHDDLNATDFTGSTLPISHDELLAKIDNLNDNEDSFWPYINALRAVVELHKPMSGWDYGREVENHHCSCDSYEEYDWGYPCPTIQAITEMLI